MVEIYLVFYWFSAAIHIDRCDVRGYTAWALLDDFEWNIGFNEKFGFYHVDFNDPGRKRTPKDSAIWYRSVGL